MERTMILNHLAQAERHVKEGEQHVAKQRALVGILERDGHDTAVAIRLLNAFEALQVMHITDRDRIAAELAQVDATTGG